MIDFRSIACRFLVNWRPVDCIPTGIVYPDRDRCFCPDRIARIQPGNRAEIDGKSTGCRHENRLEINPIPKKMSSSQKCSHQNSYQNGPVVKFTALTATIFVTISAFISWGHFGATFGELFVLGALVARIGRKPLCRDTFFCLDARIHSPGYCWDTIHQSAI